MAILDPRSDTVVIRVVYDGAPMAGKSTTVRALGRGLGGEVVSPAEIAGRTLYFDWLDYTGGLFEGRRIRCQIVSVPGQATLAPRRRRLLESADAIVFVGDSTPAGFAADRNYLGGLRSVLEGRSPPVGIVFQANKRDCPGAIAIDTVRSMLDELELRVGVVESVATDSTGIREAFVFAVRLALDRVRDLMRTGELATSQPDVDNAQELLEELRRNEDGSMDYAAQTGLVHTRLAEIQPDSILATSLVQASQGQVPQSSEIEPSSRPATPDAGVASGMVWPPVDGRLVLHELAQAPIALQRADNGDWAGTSDGKWRLHSGVDAVFPELEQGRAVLVQSARIQAAQMRESPKACCIALAADGHGQFRLWRIERIA
jgi:signal recognition particle receptor subunit beta